MPTLTIKGIPEDILRRMKRRAAVHRRSLNSEVIVCLGQAARTPAMDPGAFLTEIDEMRARLALPPLTETKLRKAKAAGRP
ncbi:MAG: Arc family DNA-binding protein [Candidatus Sumerlaeota bacterium]|nr:Arc family DNA-binding protein [Candidatus Sumerlaeota bacterium]